MKKSKSNRIGRPSVPENLRKKKVGFSLPPDVNQAVREIAKKKKISISKVVEDALMKEIANHFLNRG